MQTDCIDESNIENLAYYHENKNFLVCQSCFNLLNDPLLCSDCGYFSCRKCFLMMNSNNDKSNISKDSKESKVSIDSKGSKGSKGCKGGNNYIDNKIENKDIIDINTSNDNNNLNNKEPNIINNKDQGNDLEQDQGNDLELENNDMCNNSNCKELKNDSENTKDLSITNTNISNENICNETCGINETSIINDNNNDNTENQDQESSENNKNPAENKEDNKINDTNDNKINESNEINKESTDDKVISIIKETDKETPYNPCSANISNITNNKCIHINLTEITKPHKLMLETLKLKCKYGCKLSLLAYFSHLSLCEYNNLEVTCWNCLKSTVKQSTLKIKEDDFLRVKSKNIELIKQGYSYKDDIKKLEEKLKLQEDLIITIKNEAVEASVKQELLHKKRENDKQYILTLEDQITNLKKEVIECNLQREMLQIRIQKRDDTIKMLEGKSDQVDQRVHEKENVILGLLNVKPSNGNKNKKKEKDKKSSNKNIIELNQLNDNNNDVNEIDEIDNYNINEINEHQQKVEKLVSGKKKPKGSSMKDLIAICESVVDPKPKKFLHQTSMKTIKGILTYIIKFSI